MASSLVSWKSVETDMAVTLTHDVISHCNARGSPVYCCSLDAEGAFDALPHSVLLHKAVDIVPDHMWATLVYWYARLKVQVKWLDFLASPIPVLKGTRQGGLSSPFLFNIFYKDLVTKLNNKSCGIRIFGQNYNVFCYADDLLLMSLTTSGLQQLIETANATITAQALRFNASKTTCTAHGLRSMMPPTEWTLNGTQLSCQSDLAYLGVTLNASSHVEQRTKACRRAFFSLESAGLHPRGLAPVTMAHLWNAAVRPVLTYGSHCIHMTKRLVDDLDKTCQNFP